jgi:hypothetical protein
MSDREQRALGVGGTITVREKKYELSPIAVQHLCNLEKESLRYYKRQFLQTFADNADLLGENSQDIITKKMEEAAVWDLDDLPKKTAYDVSHVPVTEKLREWAKAFQVEIDGEKSELTDVKIRAMLSTALDQEKVKREEVKAMAGKFPVQGKVRYDQWWVTGSMEGMVSFLLSSIQYKHPEVTEKEVKEWPISSIFEGAREVESITSPNLKNG